MPQRSLLPYAGLFLCSLVALATLGAAEPASPPELRAARKEDVLHQMSPQLAEQREEYAALEEELRAEGRGRLKARRKGISGE